MASHNGKKSFGLRMLWIPGGRKSHPKGRYDSTNKRVPYSARQKKSEVWSLGGSRAQSDLLRAEPDVSLLDGPSTSSIATLACATATGTAAAVTATSNTNSSNSASSPPPLSTECLEDEAAQNNASSVEVRNHRPNTAVTTPTTPDSTTSTALLLSAPQSPLTVVGDLEPIDSDSANPSNVHIMPAKARQMAPTVPVIVTTTTTAQIMEDNRFSILGKDITTNEFDIYTLPSPPRDKDQEHLNSSSGTTASQKSSMGSPRKDHETSSTTESHDHHHNLNNGSLNNSPSKKKHHQRNHNNNQGDVNSIESITEDTASEKIPSGDLDWVEHVIQDRNNREILAKSKKKKKKKLSSAKELDQLDGVPTKEDPNDETLKDEDEKVVKCLYYTLMCCDCTIS